MLLKKLITLFVTLSIALSAMSQGKEDLVSLKLNKATLPEFCQAIQQQTSYTFAYGEDIEFNTPLTITVNNKPISEVLSEILSGYGLSYRMTDHHILLFKKRKHGGDAGGNKSTMHTISGYIVDASSQETLIGATAYSLDHQKGTVSNVYGFFSLTVPSEETTLNFSFIGYAPKNVSFALKGDTMVTIAMQGDLRLEEVVVQAELPETGVASSRMGSETLQVEAIKNLPAVMGEPDVMKAIQTLPGVQKGVAGASGVHVRGGGTEQNLYLLDGVPMYNIDHMLGFFSAFTPDAVKNVEFYKSSFPSRYGGRLSSVIDVRTKDGDMEHYHGMLSVGLVSSHASVEGPICKDRTSFIVTARRSYTNLFAQIIDMGSGLNFYDINAKVNHIFSKDDRLFASFYMGRDFMHTKDDSNDHEEYYGMDDMLYVTDSRYYNKSALSTGNTLFSLRWNHVFSPRVFSNMTLAYDRFNVDIDHHNIYKFVRNDEVLSDNDYSSSFKSGIDDLTAIMDIDFHPGNSRRVKMGGLYILHKFYPQMETSHMQGCEADSTINVSIERGSLENYGHEADLYYEEELRLGDNWQVIAGLRGTLFYIDSKTYYNVEPRLSATYKKGDWRFKAAYTSMHQYVHLLSTSPVTLPSDLWVPIDRNTKPMSSNQYSLGVYRNIHSEWQLSVEAFYKDMRHILDYKDGANYAGSSEQWSELVASGKGYSKGVELMAKRSVGRTTGSVSYTLSKSERKFDLGVSGGKWYPDKYDRRHTLCIGVQHKFSEKVDINATWSYASGGYATVARNMTQYDTPSSNTYSSVLRGDYVYYGGRNNYQLDATHQLDLGINFNRQLKHAFRTISFSVVNAYNHLNPDIVYVERRRENDSDEYRTFLKQKSLIPILPSLSYTIHF